MKDWLLGFRVWGLRFSKIRAETRQDIWEFEGIAGPLAGVM